MKRYELMNRLALVRAEMHTRSELVNIAVEYFKDSYKNMSDGALVDYARSIGNSYPKSGLEDVTIDNPA